MARIKLNDRRFRKRMEQIQDYINDDLGGPTLKDFRKETPKASGNARNKTKLKNKKTGWEIRADYAYSGVLDRGLYPDPPKKGTGKTSKGYSTQAPEGMVRPTLDKLRKRIDKYLRRTR